MFILSILSKISFLRFVELANEPATESPLV
jgi:hypothetical protein